MKGKIRLIIITTLLVLLCGITSAYATAPTEAEMQAFQSAMSLYEQSMGMGMSFDPNADPNAEPPTPEQLKQDAILAFQGFITTYPTSELAPVAQNYIGWCYFELGNNTQSKVEFQKIVTDYPASKLVDDARYQIAFIEFQANDYATALADFQSIIDDYETNTDEALTHKIPFAYFMVGDCYRKMDDMTNARAIWNQLIAKFPTHSQAGRAQKRLNP